MWYDGNDANGDGVPTPGLPIIRSWKDKSGYQRHATTSGGPNVTSFPLTSLVGPSAMTFNRKTTLMAQSSYGDISLFDKALHMFVVMKEMSDVNTEPSESTPVSFGIQSIFDPFDNRRTFPLAGIDVAVPREYDVKYKHAITIWEVLIYQESESTSYYKEWFNGVPAVFDPSITGRLSRFRPMKSRTADFFIANRIPPDNKPAPRGWNGFIYDIAIYNRALPTVERQLVEGYFARKWGIQSSLPALHPYQSVAPSITTLISAPIKPFSLLTSVVPTGLMISWLGGEGADSYVITLISSLNTYTIPVSSANIYSTTVTTVQSGSTYSLMVSAVNISGSTPSDTVQIAYYSTQVATVAGSSGAGTSRIDGTTTQFIYNPSAVVSDSCGSLFVADANNYIRKIYIKRNSSGTTSMVTTFAGNGSIGNMNTGSASGSSSSFNRPQGLAIDTQDTLYIADTNNHCIRKISAQGVVTTFSGSGSPGMINNPAGAISMFNFPMGVAVDSAGTVYVADTGNHTIRKITPAGAVTTFAGSMGVGSQDGIGQAASFNTPCGIAVDSLGNVYVADTGNHSIRKITSTGTVTTVAGLSGTSGFIDATGSCARFNSPMSITIDSNGALYVCERMNHTVRKIVLTSKSSSAGSGSGSGSCSTTNNEIASVITMAGNGTAGSANGMGVSSRFNTPNALCFDPLGNIYVADTLNNTIRMITILPSVIPSYATSCVTLCKPCCPGTTTTQPGASICVPSAAF